MQNIVFFGSGAYTIPIIQTLQKHGLKLVVTTEKDGKLIDFLKSSNIPFITSELKNPADLEKIKSLKPTLGILASYGVLIKKTVIDIFPMGIINVHPSLLPLYRGASPIQSTILNGETVTGVTLHVLDEQLDHGPLIAQEEYELVGTETTAELKEILFAKSADMLDRILKNLEEGKELQYTIQDETKATFTPRQFSREEGKIELTKLPDTKKLDRMIRAYYPWPGVWFETKFNNQTKRIKLLPGKKIQIEGKNIMSFKDFANGYGKEGKLLLEKLGINF